MKQLYFTSFSTKNHIKTYYAKISIDSWNDSPQSTAHERAEFALKWLWVHIEKRNWAIIYDRTHLSDQTWTFFDIKTWKNENLSDGLKVLQWEHLQLSYNEPNNWSAMFLLKDWNNNVIWNILINYPSIYKKMEQGNNAVSNIRNKEMFDRFQEQAPSYVSVIKSEPTNIILDTKAPPQNQTRWMWKSISTDFDASLWRINLTTPSSDPFTKAEWKNTSLDSLWLSLQQLSTLTNNRFWLNNPRDIAIIKTKNGDNTILIPSTIGDWFVTICASGSVNVYDKNTPIPAGGVARKPVIYLYPKKKTKISVSVELHDAQIIAEYPKSKNGIWEIEASPRGNLVDLNSGKKYKYLFWEAEKKWGFTLDIPHADCVANKDMEIYLETSLKILGLNTREMNDFIVYWLPVLEKNPYSLIEWKTAEYTQMAKLNIVPNPESLIRVFMVFRNSDILIQTNKLTLKKVKRKWYSAIEWGGCNLDENWVAIR